MSLGRSRSLPTPRDWTLLLLLAACICQTASAAQEAGDLRTRKSSCGPPKASICTDRMDTEAELPAAVRHQRSPRSDESWGSRLAQHLTQGLTGLSMPAAPRRILAAISNSSCQPSSFMV